MDFQFEWSDLYFSSLQKFKRISEASLSILFLVPNVSGQVGQQPEGATACFTKFQKCTRELGVVRKGINIRQIKNLFNNTPKEKEKCLVNFSAKNFFGGA